MKTFIFLFSAAAVFIGGRAAAQTTSYVNYIRQFQMPSQVQWDASSNVPPGGEQLSALEINPGGARFDLYTMQSSSVTGLTEYMLATNYVGAYIPIATLVIRSEDSSASTPRTRADRPFFMDVTMSGLRTGADDPVPSKSVKFFRHVQSYGVAGTGVGLDRNQATLLDQTVINTNGLRTDPYLVNLIPGADRKKVRGEQRFTVKSLADYQAPETQLASQFITIWPCADASITGISQNQLIRFLMPAVTLTFNDLYPGSRTYAQVYKGEQQLGMVGRIVPGSGFTNTQDFPVNPILSLTAYDSVFDSDGRWTMELITVTPFGTERMRTPGDQIAYVTFDLDRNMEVNGSFTTIEE